MDVTLTFGGDLKSNPSFASPVCFSLFISSVAFSEPLLCKNRLTEIYFYHKLFSFNKAIINQFVKFTLVI